MKMMFNELFLFAPEEKKARKLTFKEGINVITSSQENGTDRGKSVIMRSLYYTLGAETFFDKNWDKQSKVFILKFQIDDSQYYIYRSGELFKFFDQNMELLFTTVRRKELAEKLLDYTRFSVQLPDRGNNKLEITPPVFNYLPFFLDQDHYDCSKFTSFDKLAQYEKIKDNVIYYHLGAYDEEYFELVKKKEILSDKISEIEHRNTLLMEMKADIDSKLECDSYAGDVDALNNEIDIHKREYASVLQELNTCKKKLINLRNEFYEVEQLLKEISSSEKKNKQKIKKVRRHICPECGSEIEDSVSIKSKLYVFDDDLISVKNQMQAQLAEIQNNIEKEEEKYRTSLNAMNVYQEKMKINTSQVSNVLRYKGFCEIREGIVSEQCDNNGLYDEKKSKLAAVNRDIRKYGDKKKKINDKYCMMVSQAKTKFGLNEINLDKVKNIMSDFSASGSNKNIVTVIWFIFLIKLREEFNMDAIVYPAVFDSPNNTETDNEKKKTLFQFLLDELKEESQAILSSIGFDKDDFNIDVPVNVIELTNEKYNLLNDADYTENCELLEKLCDAKN